MENCNTIFVVLTNFRVNQIYILQYDLRITIKLQKNIYGIKLDLDRNVCCFHFNGFCQIDFLG